MSRALHIFSSAPTSEAWIIDFPSPEMMKSTANVGKQAEILGKVTVSEILGDCQRFPCLPHVLGDTILSH
ncbi:hypothetical protein GE061_007746 [Apolygus lucorum]|uniref:Uncharacterized protein n=1 Tax=Apolygus lucorum TaxID=248454 RepID=A0A8S9WPD4_APOLU|nr:hypothetical protein GE061_007746 [Apolygus lucorum]